MNPVEAEEQLKLHMLTSLVRSQRALAQMIESMAHTAVHCHGQDPSADKLLKEAAAIMRYQQVVLSRVSGLPIRRIQRGKPGKLWLSAGVQGQR